MKPSSPQTESLRANALSFPAALTQGITHIAPATGLVVARSRTPGNANALQTFITLTLGIAIGFWISSDQEYYFFGIDPVLHFVFPVLSTLSLMWVACHSVVPLPDAPLRYAPILVGVWEITGVVLLLTCVGRPICRFGLSKIWARPLQRVRRGPFPRDNRQV
jgi:hypothetical protein